MRDATPDFGSVPRVGPGSVDMGTPRMQGNEARLAYRCPRCRAVLYEFWLSRGGSPRVIAGSGPLADRRESSYRCACGQGFAREEAGSGAPVGRWIPVGG